MREGRVRRHPGRGAGYAEVLLPGAAIAAADARFRLVWEAHANPNLGPRGWQPAEAILHAEEAVAQGADLVLTLGPEICEHLVSENYELVLLRPPVRYVLPWIEIPRRPSDRRGGFVGGPARPAAPAGPDATLIARTPFDADATVPRGVSIPLAPAPEPAPTPAGPAAPAGAERTENAETPSPGRRWVVAVGPLLLLLLLLAAAAWWFHPWPTPDPQPTPPDPPPAQISEPPPAPTPVLACRDALGAVGGWPPARAILRRPDCPPGDLPALAGALQEAGRHDDALQLLEFAAERGVAPAMAMLARLYDPTGFQPGRPFAEPDIRQAARFYAEAVRAGDASAETPRAALRALLEARAREGDMLAELTLRDFWP